MAAAAARALSAIPASSAFDFKALAPQLRYERPVPKAFLAPSRPTAYSLYGCPKFFALAPEP